MIRALGRTVLLAPGPEAALGFYRDVLGFEVRYDQTHGELRYLHVGVPGQPDAGLWLLPPGGDADRALVGRQAGEQPLLVCYTDDLGPVLERLGEHDVETWGFVDDAGARSVHLRDVLGNVLVVAEVPAGAG